MLQKEIPFEIHLTTDVLSTEQEARFIAYCLAQEAKPLLIELAQGTYHTQPMLSMITYDNSLENVLSKATALSNGLVQESFGAKRLKIEIPANHDHLFLAYPSAFEKYYEWHGKISYRDLEKLAKLCRKHKVHLSKNALKNEATSRFITLREYGSKSKFEKRIEQLINDLNAEGREITKQQSEYCIYDNNSFLDQGWLPK